MKVYPTSLDGLVIIEPVAYEDARGWLLESFSEPEFHKALGALGFAASGTFVQEIHSCSKKGVLRGLHYQVPPHDNSKLLRVVSGVAYNVVVDIRRNSKTFGDWYAVELNSIDQQMLWIPEGFAHGFVSLEDDTQVIYKSTAVYSEKSERCIKWDDPDLGIVWPDISDFVVSEKDVLAPALKDAETYTDFLEGTFELIDVKVIGDERGSLIALEQGQNIPFKIQRAYYIFDTRSDVSRGFHAHRRLEQMAVCVSGSCKMLLDDGASRKEIWLDSNSKALIIRNMIWREMHEFSADCVLLVFASEHYSESDYIRDYDTFVREVKNGKE